MNKTDNVIEIAKIAEQSIENPKGNLFIPILDGFKELPDTNAKQLVAINGNTMEQFLVDGVLEENETLETRISKVKEDLKNNLPNPELYDGDTLIYYEDYESNGFYFKLYCQDILLGTKEDLYFIRQLNGYFINNVTREFCQISLSAGKYKVTPETKLLNDIEDIDTDKILIGLRDGLELIMDNVKYSQ